MHYVEKAFSPMLQEMFLYFLDKTLYFIFPALYRVWFDQPLAAKAQAEPV